jgi:lysophospholipase L1-like esterase
VAALDVESTSNTGTVVALGDSITDGQCSTRDSSGIVQPDQYNRWTDVLAARFAAAPAEQSKAVANEGIAGNTVVSGGAGFPALLRMNSDVLVREGVTHLILFEGTNDLGNNATAQSVITGDQQIINRAHAAGLKIIGATIIPRGGEKAWTKDMEPQRLELNEWIRHRANFDGVIDFDELMEGPVNSANNSVTLPSKWSCSDGDGVHPNSAGYAAMGAAIDLSLFSKHEDR